MIMSVVWCTVEPLLPSANTAFCRTGNGPIRPVFPWAGRGLASSLRRVFAPRITRNRPRGFGPSQVGQQGVGGGDRAVERLPHLHYRSFGRAVPLAASSPLDHDRGERGRAAGDHVPWRDG